MAKTLIRVGHSAYRGVNAYRLCFSKAQAVRVLRNRGVTRDMARVAVSKAVNHLGAMVRGENGEVIEIVNAEYGLNAGHFGSASYDELRQHWSAAPEL